MNRPLARRVLSVMGAVVLAGTVAACRDLPVAAGEYAGANVLVILLDTQRADALGCYGGKPGTTPFLDALARRSVVFHRAYAPVPWTMPSVASLFTSLYAAGHGVLTFASELPDVPTLAGVLRDGGWLTHGVSANILIREGGGFGRGFDELVTLPTVGGARGSSEVMAASRGESLRVRALDWVLGLPDEHRRARSFLYLQYMEPHTPLLPDRDLLEEAARAAGVPVPSPQDLEKLSIAGTLAPLAPAQARQYRAAYDASVQTLDRRLAGLFDDLGRTGFLDRAIVVVLGDHGEEIAEHGGMGHGHTLFEEQLRVPLLVSLPGQDARVDVEEVVSLVDVAPTLLDLLGLPAPASFAGRSLREPIAAAASLAGRFARLLHRAQEGGPGAEAEILAMSHGGASRRPRHRRAVVLGTRKVIERPDGSLLFFDLDTDAGEQSPIAPEGGGADAFAALRDRLRALERQEEPAGKDEELSPEQVERLRALGYLN